MDLDTLKKIEDFANIIPSMEIVFRDVVNYWSPEMPPLTILFSELGDTLMGEFDSLSIQKSQMIFEAIEAMLEGENEQLDLGATTGFLEQIASSPNFTPAVKSMLGRKSRAFLRDWNNFLGIQDQDL
jgi:hypothetical protein